MTMDTVGRPLTPLSGRRVANFFKLRVCLYGFPVLRAFGGAADIAGWPYSGGASFELCVL